MARKIRARPLGMRLYAIRAMAVAKSARMSPTSKAVVKISIGIRDFLDDGGNTAVWHQVQLAGLMHEAIESVDIIVDPHLLVQPTAGTVAEYVGEQNNLC